MSAAINCIRGCAAAPTSSAWNRPISASSIRRALPQTADFAAIDVSFISLKLVLPAVGRLLAAEAALVALIKPQFEAGRRDVKKGIVRDEAVRTQRLRRYRCVSRLARLAHRSASLPSAILGGDGNREFFIEAERG